MNNLRLKLFFLTGQHTTKPFQRLSKTVLVHNDTQQYIKIELFPQHNWINVCIHNCIQLSKRSHQTDLVLTAVAWSRLSHLHFSWSVFWFLRPRKRGWSPLNIYQLMKAVPWPKYMRAWSRSTATFLPGAEVHDSASSLESLSFLMGT